MASHLVTHIVILNPIILAPSSAMRRDLELGGPLEVGSGIYMPGRSHLVLELGCPSRGRNSECDVYVIFV